MYFLIQGSTGLYSLVGQRAFFLQTKESVESSTVIQITKNFPTLAQMTGDENMLEINQKWKDGKVDPVRDSLRVLKS